MKRNFAKKLLCGALSLLTALAAFPMSAFVAEADSAQSGFSGATVYLIDLSSDKITPPTGGFGIPFGTGSYALRYSDTESKTFEKSVFNHAAPNDQWWKANCTYTFDISDYTAQEIAFSSYIGFVAERGGATDTNKKGKAAFCLYADNVLIKKSDFLTVDSPLTQMVVTVPAGTQKLRFEQDAGEKNDTDWCLWGDPKLILPAKAYLADLPMTMGEPNYNSREAANTYTLRYSDTESVSLEKSFRNDMTGAGNWWASANFYSFDVSEYTASGAITFTSYIGFLDSWGGNTDTNKEGKAAFSVYADDVLAAQSDFITPDDPLTRMTAVIPQGTKSIKLLNDAGESGAWDYCMWGTPYIAPSSDSISEVIVSCEKEVLAVDESAALSVRAILSSGADAVLSDGDIAFESSEPEIISVSGDGTLTAAAQGSAIVTVTVTVAGTSKSAAISIRCGDAGQENLVRYLGDMPRLSASVGWGQLIVDGGFDGRKIHFASGNITCDKGITAHAPSEITYNIEGLPVLSFRATAGILDDEAAGKGLVKFLVYADDTLLFESEKLTNQSAPADIIAPIPSGSETLRLVIDDCGSKDSDHSAWGNARIIIDGAHAKDIYSFAAALSEGILAVGEKTAVSVSGTLVDGSPLDAENASLTYASENEEIFTVDENGTVLGVGDGIGTLTVTASSGLNQKTASVRVIVGNAETDTLKRVASPDGSRVLCVYLDENGTARYMLLLNGKTLLPLSTLGFVTDSVDFTKGLSLESVSEPTAVNESYTLTARTKEHYENSGTERTFTFNKDGAKMGLTVRVFDNGAAFRYTLTSKNGEKLTIKEEKTELSVSPAYRARLMPYNTGLEGNFRKYEKSGISAGISYNLPALLADEENDRYCLATEAVFNPEYSGSHVEGTTDGNLRIAAYNNETVTVSSPFTTPWRVLAAGSLADITENSLVTDLSDDPDENIDYSFAVPGISAWSWLTEGGSGQVNLATHKKYVDYAAEMGWSYYTLDDGWQPRDGSTYKIQGGTYDWFPELVEYANNKGVKLIVWVHKVNCVNENDMNALLEEYASLGVAGIKIDFFDSEAQSIMALYDRVYKKCASLGLVVNCHGANKPTGEVRTYPNVMAREAVRGEEYRFESFDAAQYTILPFIRGTVGPADVTEMLSPSLYADTTCGSQVAMSILMASGIHYMGSGPEEMEKSPAKGLYRNFPAVWDDTKLIEGKLGEYAALLRRSGKVYYAAGITTEERTASFRLDFLGDGKYLAELYRDGGDIMTLVRETSVVEKGDTITVSMLRRGGATIRLTPLSDFTTPESLSFDTEKIILDVGTTLDLTPAVSNGASADALLYSSSNENVVSYEGGRLYAKAAGAATVRVTSANDPSVFAECFVGVRRADGSTPAVEVTAPDIVAENTPFTISFDASEGVSEADYRLYDGDFSPVAISFRSTSDGKVSLTLSLPCGDVLSICDGDGNERTFVKVSSSVTLTFDGKDDITASSGESVTLPANDAENFAGWRYGEKTYAPKSTFTVPYGVSKVLFTTAKIGENGEAVVYLDPQNGDDGAFGFSSENPVKTLEKAAEKLNAYTGSEEKILAFSGELSVSGTLPSGAFTYRGRNGAGFTLADGLTLAGDTTFESFNLCVSGQFLFINTRGNALTFGEGITNVGSKWPCLIHSGTQNYNGKRERITIDSGIVTIYAGTYYNYDNAKTTAGADYTVNGGDVTLTFRSDGYLAEHKGATFTDTVNILHNGGRLAVSVGSSSARPVTFEKAVTLISNYGAKPIVSDIAPYAEGGFYSVVSEKFGSCHVESDAPGSFRILCDEGVNAFADGVKCTSFKAESGKTVTVTYRADKAASIGSTLYDTLSDALSAAQAGDTVTLLQSAATQEALPVKSGVLLDLDLFAVTGKLILSEGAAVAAKRAVSEILPSLAGENGGGIVFRTENGKNLFTVGSLTKNDGKVLLSGDTLYTVRENGEGLQLSYADNEKEYTAHLADVSAISGKNIAFESGAVESLTALSGGTLTLSGGKAKTVLAENKTTVNLAGGKFDSLLRGDKNASVTVNTSDSTYIFSGFGEDDRARFITLLMYGMQLRTSGVQGLRFIARLSGEYKNRTDFSYGLVVLPGNLIPDGEELTIDTARAKTIESRDDGFKIFDEDDEARLYTVCITGIAASDYNRRYTVRAFIRYTVNGGEKIVYSDGMSGSILEVIEGLKTQYPGQYDELYDTIMQDYSDTFLSAGEFKTLLISEAENGMKTFPLSFSSPDTALSLTGECGVLSDWSVTDYIALDIEKYPILQYCLSGKKGVLSAAFYDGEKNFLSGIGSSSTDEYEILIYNAEIPKEAKYVRFSTHNAFTYSRAEACADIGEKLNAYSTAKDKTDLSGKKIVCVGDSLTYGDYGTTVHGKGYPHAENYPYYLAKYTGASVEWYACGGYTAKALARDYADGVFSGIGRPGVSVSVKDADIVLVMLGTNGGLPLVGDRSNYDAYLSLANNLKNDVKKGARVVLMTPPPATTDESKVNYGYAPNVASAYAGVYKIAGNLSLPVFDVYRDAGFSDENEALFRPNDGLHFAGVGYGALAAFAANELRLLENDRLSALNLSETENKKDEEFLSTIAYPAYTITDGTYATLGRWFKKTVNGTECDVTVTSGSQLSFLTSGATKATIGFESMCDDTPYFAVSIDGGDYTRYPATENEIMLPDAGRHAVTVVMDGISENIGKWESENGYAVKEITVDKGRIRAIEPTNDVIFYYGDSITEGVMSANSGISCGKNNSAVHTYAFESARILGATPYFIGYGATGVTSDGSFAKFSDAIDHLSKLREDNGEIMPREIVIHHGYNDGATTFEADLRAALEKLTARFADTPIYYVIPLAQKNVDAIRTVCGEFDAVSVIETESLSVEYGTDGIHPTANGAKTAGKYVARAIEKARLSTSKYADYIEYGKSLQNIHHKLLTDKTANIAYYGGSITQGYGASDSSNIWRNRTKQWFKEHYPDAEINEIYACFGESGTYLGTYLLDDYILSQNPDLVFLEYAINDRYANLTKEESRRGYETIIRTIKERFPKCDIVSLITLDYSTKGDAWYFEQAAAHAEVAGAYDVPVIFMGHALSDYIQKENKSWWTYFIDIVHPTDDGYAFYTDVIFEFLNNELCAKVLPDEYLADDTLPSLLSDYLLDGDRKLIQADESTLAGCDKTVWSWCPGNYLDDAALRQKGFVAAKIEKNPTFVYTFTGTELALYTNIKNSAFSFTYTVDDGEEKTGTFKSHNPTPIVSGLPAGEHTVKISLADGASELGISDWYISLILTRDASKQTEK